MFETIRSDLYRIEVPLPNNPLRSLNSYVVTGGERALVVDTGMNQPECRAALETGLGAIGVDLTRTDFLITHFHADHLGLVATLAASDARVYFNEPEAVWTRKFKTADFISGMLERARVCGFPDNRLEEGLKQHPGIKYGPLRYPEFAVLHDGDIIEVGAYRFTCIQTPGHSPGHLCLYEPDKKILLSGDHVLGDITPNISGMLDDQDMLGAYLQSLDKVYELDVALVLPGHRRVFSDLKGRIHELREHHQIREAEVMTLLKTGVNTAYEMATRMSWDFVAESWDHFPLMQQWFAVGEAAAHLRHLVAKGAACRTMRDGICIYTVA